MIRTAPDRTWLDVAALALLGTVVLGPVVARAADHLDSPRTKVSPQVLGNLDINDVYIFQGAGAKNTVLIMTLSPAAGILGPTTFSTFGTYQFLIENSGDTTPDITIQFNFGTPSKTGQQPFQYAALDTAGNILLSGGGLTGRNNLVPGGGKVQPDLYDDPFFFDLNAFNLFKAEALAGNPNAANVFLKRGVNNIPQNFFAGFNVLAIVIEVPSVRLQPSPQITNIGVWARTLVPGGNQFDRMARPAVNTVLIPDDLKDAFNSFTPALDTIFIPAATAELTRLFGNPTRASTIAKTLLPDVMTFDTSSRAGFLNGRQLPDDVIDAELSLLTGGAVTGDGVVNDSVFRPQFPYLGTPNPKTLILGKMRAQALGL